jgi:cell shape-determining protein MreD
VSWLPFAIAAWLALGLELGFADALQLGTVNVTPSFAMVLLAFVCLWSSPAAGMVAALILGVALDLTRTVSFEGGREIAVLGPNALGCLLAAYTVVTLRALMFRKNVLSLGFLAAIAAGLKSLVALALLEARSIYDPVMLDPALPALGQALGSAVYTGVVAMLLAPFLNLLRPLFDFHDAKRGAFRIQ